MLGLFSTLSLSLSLSLPLSFVCIDINMMLHRVSKPIYMNMEAKINGDVDDDNRRQGEYRAICLWKMEWQSFAIMEMDCITLASILDCLNPRCGRVGKQFA